MTEQNSKMDETEKVEQSRKARTSKLALWSFVLGVYLCIICSFIAVMIPHLFIPPEFYWFYFLLFMSLFFPCYIVSLILGIISIFIVKRHKDELKGIGLAVAGIVLDGILIVIIITVSLMFVRPAVPRMLCAMNMSGLGKAILLYAGDFDGKYPTTNKWCDLLVEYEKVNGKTFRCPANKKERCSFAMNPNCEPNSPAYVVLLFETKGGWNQSGGPEIVTFENHKEKGCNILFNDGHVVFVKPERISKLKWKAEQF